MNIRIAGIVNDSIVDGPGFRLSVFTQGCIHDCLGCHNPKTHDFNGGYDIDTDAILLQAKENILLDGVTLSGGEPFCQAEACAKIARGSKKIGLNVWCYTGYTFEELLEGCKEWHELLREIDVLVDGRFEIEKKSLDCRFRGSSNQRLIDVQASLANGKTILYEA